MIPFAQLLAIAGTLVVSECLWRYTFDKIPTCSGFEFRFLLSTYLTLGLCAVAHFFSLLVTVIRLFPNP